MKTKTLKNNQRKEMKSQVIPLVFQKPCVYICSKITSISSDKYISHCFDLCNNDATKKNRVTIIVEELL